MKFSVPEGVARRAARQLLLLQKSSPTIMFGAGVVGIGVSAVLACRSTLKLENILDKTANDLDVAKTLEHEDYSDSERQKDITLIYVRAGFDVTKLYAPAVLLGVASIGILTKSHLTLTKRVDGITAAYTALEKGFAEYRKRVVDEFGEDKDRDFRYASEVVSIRNEATGRTKKEKHVAPGAASIYARFFDEYSPSWSATPEWNLVFLRCQQQMANDLLYSRGHLFLNEVYDMLGIERSKAGAVVGWVISYDGDNFVDFGFYENDQQARNFVNGREGSVLLDFNVDGVIFDKINRDDRGAIAWQKD